MKKKIKKLILKPKKNERKIKCIDKKKEDR